MIICPNCSHQNPDGATYCDACYTPLPVVVSSSCPNCGAAVLSDASFCGGCGFNLKPQTLPAKDMPEETENITSAVEEPLEITTEMPELLSDDDIILIPQVESAPSVPRTQLQQIGAFLVHAQTNAKLELPTNLQVIHIGKPNNMIPPDIDVSGFPDSDIVSRVHADIRFEGNAFYFEDTGSSNGTYINNTVLTAGNRHKLRPGDRISLGKGDRVSFIFQMD
jgi:hypothetical protein